MNSNKIIIGYYLVVATTIFSGCNNSVTDNLIDKVNHDCKNYSKSGCRIVFKDVTKFTWDKMYLFGDWTNSDSIAKVIGFNYEDNDVPDDYTRMIFTYRNKVVYEEDFKALFYNNSTVEFKGAIDSFEKSRPYQVNVSEAIFSVEKNKINGSCTTCFVYSLIVHPWSGTRKHEKY